MYLLMLLATFVSAIYGYNLSARADYDRDIAKKKAMAIIYRFIFQDKSTATLLTNINHGMYKDTGYGLSFVLPDDRVYADYNSSTLTDREKETTLFIQQVAPGAVGKDYFHLRASKKKGEEGASYQKKLSADVLEAGKKFYDGSVMVSKALCTDKHLGEDGSVDGTGIPAKSCTPEQVTDPVTGEVTGVTKTCCVKYTYLVSYRSLDARWVSRIHKGFNMDFMNALSDRNYTDNIGFITYSDGQWHFKGKIHFEPVFYKDKSAWEAEHSGTSDYYPIAERNRTTWDLPKAVFDRNYFKDKNNNNMCDEGCLFRIKYF